MEEPEFCRVPLCRYMYVPSTLREQFCTTERERKSQGGHPTGIALHVTIEGHKPGLAAQQGLVQARGVTCGL